MGMYIHVPHPSLVGGCKKASDVLKLEEVQMIVSLEADPLEKQPVFLTPGPLLQTLSSFL